MGHTEGTGQQQKATQQIRTCYPYIRFYELIRGKKTSVWACQNRKHGTILGAVKWNAPWRQYCFFSEREIILSAGCHRDIADFIDQLMRERKEKP